jgi:hypothetical protein
MGVKSLPKKLLLRMDDCVKNNKNHQLLAFLSLLTICEVFEKVQLRFLAWAQT